MKKALAVLLLFAVGAVYAVPRTSFGWKPLISVCIAAETGDSIVPAPPAPAPGGVCSNCNGSGKVGDGTVFTKCIPCDGTGKVKPKIDEPSILEVEPEDWEWEEDAEAIYKRAWDEAMVKGLPLALFIRVPSYPVPGAVVCEYKGESFPGVYQIYVLRKDPNYPTMYIAGKHVAGTPADVLIRKEGPVYSLPAPFSGQSYPIQFAPVACNH